MIFIRSGRVIINDSHLSDDEAQAAVRPIWMGTTIEEHVTYSDKLHKAREGKERVLFTNSRIEDAIKVLFPEPHVNSDGKLSVASKYTGSNRIIVVRKGFTTICIRGKQVILNDTRKPVRYIRNVILPDPASPNFTRDEPALLELFS
jgi:hypothetical protein